LGANADDIAILLAGIPATYSVTKEPTHSHEERKNIMTNKEHRLGVSEVTLVVRHLKLEPTTKEVLEQALTEIDQVYGIDAISFDEKSHVLNLAYDATRTCIDGLEQTLKKYEIEISHDWWTHFKEGYHRFVDQNIQDNAKTEPWSCHGGSSQPPKQRK
jgi:hypothetical protein